MNTQEHNLKHPLPDQEACEEGIQRNIKWISKRIKCFSEPSFLQAF